MSPVLPISMTTIPPDVDVKKNITLNLDVPHHETEKSFKDSKHAQYEISSFVDLQVVITTELKVFLTFPLRLKKRWSQQ